MNSPVLKTKDFTRFRTSAGINVSFLVGLHVTQSHPWQSRPSRFSIFSPFFLFALIVRMFRILRFLEGHKGKALVALDATQGILVFCWRWAQTHQHQWWLSGPPTGWMLSYHLCFSPSTAIGPPLRWGARLGRSYLALSSEPMVVGRGCDEGNFQWKKGVFSEKGGGNSVNQGFGKDFYRKGNSVKRSGPFTEPPDSENSSSPSRKSPRPISHPNTVVGVLNRLVLNRLGGAQPRDSGARVSQAPWKQTRNKNAIESAILNRVLDRDWTLNRRGPLRVVVKERVSGSFLERDNSTHPRGPRDRKKIILARTHEKTIPPHARSVHSRLRFFILGLRFSFSLENFNLGPCFSTAREGPGMKKPFSIENFIPCWKLDFFSVPSFSKSIHAWNYYFRVI